jgi:hypothetical protein
MGELDSNIQRHFPAWQYERTTAKVRSWVLHVRLSAWKDMFLRASGDRLDDLLDRSFMPSAYALCSIQHFYDISQSMLRTCRLLFLSLNLLVDPDPAAVALYKAACNPLPPKRRAPLNTVFAQSRLVHHVSFSKMNSKYRERYCSDKPFEHLWTTWEVCKYFVVEKGAWDNAAVEDEVAEHEGAGAEDEDMECRRRRYVGGYFSRRDIKSSASFAVHVDGSCPGLCKSFHGRGEGDSMLVPACRDGHAIKIYILQFGASRSGSRELAEMLCV